MSWAFAPFTDGNVADFEPIFAELARTSNDDPDILYRPDDYAEPFFPVAQQLVADTEEATSNGDTAEAKDLFLRAAAVYRIAQGVGKVVDRPSELGKRHAEGNSEVGRARFAR